MKKTAATFAILLICLSSLLAGPHNDVSLSFGHQGGGLENREGLNWSYGISLGLSPRVEMSAWGESTLTPTFFGDGALGLGFSFALLGERSTGSYVPGSAINMLLNTGMLLTLHNPWNIFIPTTFYVSLTPLTIGSPILGHRERLFEMGLAYNWAENSFSFYFSLFKFDYYVHGTWRDWY